MIISAVFEFIDGSFYVRHFLQYTGSRPHTQGHPTARGCCWCCWLLLSAVASPAAALLLSDLFTPVCRVIGTLTSAAND